jgi:hypothetical protein
VQEVVKDARTASADMDEDAFASGRAAARLRHALEESQAALREAREALEQARGCSIGIVLALQLEWCTLEWLSTWAEGGEMECRCKPPGSGHTAPRQP